MHESSLDILHKHLVEGEKWKPKKPWKLKATDLNMLLSDIQARGVQLSKPIATVVAQVLSSYKRGYIDPMKLIPSGSYEGSIRLVNTILYAHGLDQIKTLDDPLLQRPPYPKAGG